MTQETTAQRATIIHGYAATPEDHWFAWLAAQLEAAGIPTTVPALPDPEAPDRERWQAAVAASVGTPDRGSVVVAHSLGGITVLRHLASLAQPWRLGTLVLVSGFLDTLPALPLLDDYLTNGPGVNGLREHVDRVIVIRSDCDPYVPPGHTDRLADLLGTCAQVIPGAGHFLASDGVTSLPEALAAIAVRRS